MKSMKQIPHTAMRMRLTATLAAGSLACNAMAQTLIYSENFDTDHSSDGTWVANVTAVGYNPVNLFFDYSSVGIPPAPNSTNGTTRGLKLQANLDPAVQAFPAGANASPAGFSIAQNFEMRWDWWLNYNGPLNAGGAGSTQIGGAGFGTAATFANVPTAIDCIFVGCSGDGAGTTADYRVYSPAFSASLQDASGVYAAGTVGSRNNANAYYQATFPPQSATNNCPGQLALYPQQTGLTQGGSAGMRWNDISLKKVGDIITYTINGLLIATIDISTNGTLGGANIVFGHFDINTGASTDVNATNLAFSLVDNIRITEFTNVVTVTAAAPAASEAGSAPGTFTITRTGVGAPLTVFYTMSGTAANGVDYTNVLGGPLTGSVTFNSTDTTTNITIVPVDDAIAEATETVILSINTSIGEYAGAGSATVNIADNESPQLTIAAVSTQMYERTNDFSLFRITRLGELNVASFNPNLSFSGAAANGTDFYADTPAAFDPGLQTQDVKVYPIEDAAYEGNETVTVNIAAATSGEYTIGSPGSASITLVDATSPPATVLFSEGFSTPDSAANWNVFFAASTNDFTPDYSATFGFDYSSQGIPPAPHGTGDTFGLFLTVNKDAVGSAAAVNLYPIGKSFSGNFALRFDMFISVVVPNAVSTEYVLFGVNHSGTKTNWFRSGAGGVPAGWTFDGVFYSIEADGAGLIAGNVSGGDYINYSSPTTTNNNPTALSAGRRATTLTNEFTVPPNSVPGVPGNNTSLASATPLWADVELSQIGKIITLKVNNTHIFSYSNATAYASGNIMIGYCDPFESIGLNTSYVVFDNVRVVRLTGLTINPASFQHAGANVQFDFTLDLNDTPSSFQVQGASTVTGPYANASATIVQLTPGTYRATVPKSGDVRYYRVRHQ
jgi:hypothetical protein